MMRLICLFIVALSALQTACSSYALKGKAVVGPKSTAMVVQPDDPRLAGPPVEDATLEFVLDPQSGNRKLLGTTTVGPDGSFNFPVNATGAGLLEYEIMVIARAPKRSPATATFPLPTRDQRLLVTLTAGRDYAPVNTDPVGESMNEIDRWMR